MDTEKKENPTNEPINGQVEELTDLPTTVEQAQEVKGGPLLFYAMTDHKGRQIDAMGP